ncbi:hypothetical protein PG996_002740 [Apiospora saccharicola]|uniref:Uncharacterized protein n=1 Tax=Apiospora saccharicola TaxID=335842 RepID=A0ABR1WPE0_9PEZI
MNATFAALEENNIRVTTCDLQDVVLPSHMKVMRDVFLDFQGTIFDLYDLKDNEDPWDVQKHPAWNKATDGQRSLTRELFQRAEQAKGDAETKVLERGDEAEWKDFFSESSAEKNWNLFDKRVGYRVNDRRGLLKPKPDTVCYFPIHETRNLADPLSTGKYAWRNTAHESLIQNFTLETLDQLNRFGLQYCPLDPFKGQSYSAQKLHCFPWLIAEYKVAQKQKEKCLCQAANAGTAALMLFQTAARFATDRSQERHVPPVVTITTTSNIIKVWMMYYTTKESRDAYVSSSQLNSKRD